MRNKYEKIFEPLTVKSMTLKNRIAMCPMGTNYGLSSGEISKDHISYYTQRAKGGTGLIIVENINVMYPLGSNGTTQIRVDQDSFIPRLYELCESVHRYGSCIAVQINHAGASAMSSRIGMQPVSASNIPSKAGGEIPRPLTKEEIYEIIEHYGKAAKRVQTAGFDAVEIHGGHSYLISQFLSPTTNDRTDEFGGSIENRARFARLVAEEVRKQVGDNFPIIMRVSAEEFMQDGNTLEDTLKYLECFEEFVDIFDVSAGLNGSIQKQIDASYYEDGWRAYMAKAVKEKFGKPCMTMGNIRNPQAAEDILERGDADLIGMGRGLIAEPEWANKVLEGREDELRKCISCNIGCAGHRIGKNRPIRCTVNPAVQFGDVYKEQKVNRQCNVVVIGGGTAGLEAAATAAEVGCNAFLIEKEKHLGGLATVISKLPEKNRLGDFPKYLINRAKKLKNLFIFTETEADIGFIKNLHPDVIVNATGSQPLLPPIKGLAENIDKAGGKVMSIINMIDNVQAGNFDVELEGKKVTVIGGGAVGLDVAEYFANREAEVTIVEKLPMIGNGLDPVSTNDFKTMMEEHGVVQMTDTALMEVKEDCFVIEKDGKTEELKFDYGFVCLGMKANNPVLENLEKSFEDVDIVNIGDSKRARRIIEGVEEGRNILDVLKKRNFI